MQNRSVEMVGVVMVAILLFASIPVASAQSDADKPATGSIVGAVTQDGKPVSGVGLILTRYDRDTVGQEAVSRTRSDADGRFAFRGLAAGPYRVDAFAPGLFVLDAAPGTRREPIVLNEGSEVGDISVVLSPGGAISGKLTDEDGNPVSLQTVHVLTRDSTGNLVEVPVFETTVESDDRGVFRVFGLAPGNYVVAAGSSERDQAMMRNSGVSFELRYHGGSATPDLAKAIAVPSGGEALGADIVLKRSGQTFAIRGRVIDGQSGKPIANATVRVGPRKGQIGTGPPTGAGASETGEFSLPGFPAGEYRIEASAGSGEQGSFSSESVDVELEGQDLSDVEIRMNPAATVTGTIAATESSTGLDLSMIGGRSLMLRNTEPPSGDRWSARSSQSVSVNVRPDRSFVVVGLRPGRYRVVAIPNAEVKGLYVARVELGGSQVAGELIIERAETIDKVRIVVGRTTGIVNGRLVVTGGKVVPGRTWVSIGSAAGQSRERSPVDVSGEFRIEGHAPGSFELEAVYFDRNGVEIKSRPVVVSIPEQGVEVVTLELDIGNSEPGTGGDQ